MKNISKLQQQIFYSARWEQIKAGEGGVDDLETFVET